MPNTSAGGIIELRTRAASADSTGETAVPRGPCHAVRWAMATEFVRGFKKWWDAHQPGNDDDTPGGATPIAITEPPCDDCDVIQEQPHYPWVVPGAGAEMTPWARIFTERPPIRRYRRP